jgi:phosphoribosylaminoimidazolecarboxamide formyltransferase / IMP cyclohydrolase
MLKQIKTAFISVYTKDDLGPLVTLLHNLGIEIISSSGTAKFIEDMDTPVTYVEELTGYPSIFGGRVKTLHPAVFGPILNKRDDKQHQEEKEKYSMKDIDLVIVDLYPFEKTVTGGGTQDEIIEKIDVGGPSLIRAAAKNYKDVVVISSPHQYSELGEILKRGDITTLDERLSFANAAFETTTRYDMAISRYFNTLS